MEIKAILIKPYTEKDRTNFIVEYNHRKGYVIKETETELQAIGMTEEEKQQEEMQRVALLKLTRGDVFRGLLLAKGITRAMLRTTIEAMPEETQEEKLKKEMALIDFDEALDFYRGNILIDTVGTQLGITSKQLDAFFETNDYTKLIGS
jgi:hypothetical protein